MKENISIDNLEDFASSTYCGLLKRLSKYKSEIKIKFRLPKLVFILVFITLPLQYGCKQLIVKYEDSGKTFHMLVDDVIKLQLPGDPSTGNAWRKIFYNDSVLTRVGKKNYQIGNEESGDGGFYYYRFRAIATGKSNIKMEYGNRFDSKKKTLKTFEITIIVDDQNNKNKTKAQDKKQPYE